VPKPFKIALILIGLSIVAGAVCGLEFVLREYGIWKSTTFFRISYLSFFLALGVTSLGNLWSLVRCLWLNEPVYAVKNFLLFFFPIGVLWLLLFYTSSGV